MNNPDRKLHIIIAEDDTDDGEIMVDSFMRNGFFSKIDLVRNGVELLDFLKADGPMPDIILTDINMPLMGGIEALEELCDNPVLSAIPAFVYSSTLNPIYEAKCMRLGTKGFLIKPLSLREFDEIPTRILGILQQEEQQRS
jgi:CheY-like chemotaxis protein